MRTFFRTVLGLCCLALVALGCTNYALYKPMIDTSAWAQDGKELTIAIMAIAENDAGKRLKRGAYEHELAQKMAVFIEEDVFNKQTKYADLAPQYQLQIPADLKPAKMAFVDRANIQKLMEEQDFGATDRVDENAAAKIGKIAGAKAMMFVSCVMQQSGQKEEQVYETVREDYEVDEKQKDGSMKRVTKTRYVDRPKKVGDKNIVRISQRVRVKAKVRMIEVETSKVLYSKVADSEIFEVYAEVEQGKPVKLDLKTAAEETLKSLGHKIGRLFYPIVARSGIFGGAADDPRKGDDNLYHDMTWDH